MIHFCQASQNYTSYYAEVLRFLVSTAPKINRIGEYRIHQDSITYTISRIEGMTPHSASQHIVVSRYNLGGMTQRAIFWLADHGHIAPSAIGLSWPLLLTKVNISWYKSSLVSSYVALVKTGQLSLGELSSLSSRSVRRKKRDVRVRFPRTKTESRLQILSPTLNRICLRFLIYYVIC